MFNASELRAEANSPEVHAAAILAAKDLILSPKADLSDILSEDLAKSIAMNARLQRTDGSLKARMLLAVDAMSSQDQQIIDSYPRQHSSPFLRENSPASASRLVARSGLGERCAW